MYEHFGFELKESFESKCKQLKEYRMIKTIASNNDRKISFGKLSKEDIDIVENEVKNISHEIDNLF